MLHRSTRQHASSGSTPRRSSGSASAMDLRRPNARRFGLRPRFLIATALLVVTAVTASLWTLGALSRLSAAVGEALRQNDEATAATAELASGLEREDDALLL